MSNNYFYDLDNFFGFGKPDFYFNTPVKDQKPSYLCEVENGYQILVKCLGLAEVDVSLKDKCISVVGKNEIEKSKFNTKVSIPISDDVLSTLKEINYRVECGIAVINLVCERKENEIKITKI